MKLSVYISHLQDLQSIVGDVEVVTLTATTTPQSLFVSAFPPAWVRGIPAFHPHLKPGYAWREPQDWRDAADIERVRLVRVGL